MAPFAAAKSEPRPHGIFIDVSKGKVELADAVEHTGMEAIAPEVTRKPLFFVVGSRKTAQKPTHDSRKALIASGLDLQMHMISHDAKVRDLESIALLGATEENEEKITDLAAIQEHLASIDASRDVKPCAIYKLPGTSHALHTPATGRLASNRDCFRSVTVPGLGDLTVPRGSVTVPGLADSSSNGDCPSRFGDCPRTRGLFIKW